MSLLFFFVPIHRPEPAASELNAALAAGRDVAFKQMEFRHVA